MIGDENSDKREGSKEVEYNKMRSEEKSYNAPEYDHSLSGQQAGAENATRLSKYLNALRSSGEKLPTRNGKPDKSAIALACGFNRQTLYNNPAAIALLDGATDLLDEAGSDEDNDEQAKPAVDGKAAHLRRQVDVREKRIQKLEVQVQSLKAEKTALKEALGSTKERLREFGLIEEVMTMNGRRYRP